MPVENDGLFYCNVCKESYANRSHAVKCEEGHEIIYVPLKRLDLYKLIQFLYTKDESLLSESLMSTLVKYRKNI